MTCDHKIVTHDYIEKEDCDGEKYNEWWTIEKSLCEDIDIHRFKCTGCGYVGYYSGAAKRFYENGTNSDVPGLGGEP